MAQTKGICAVCSEHVSVRKDGLVRAHGYLKGVDSAIPCAGTGYLPRTTTDGAFSALCLREGCDSPTQAIVWFEGAWSSQCGTHAKRSLKGVP